LKKIIFCQLKEIKFYRKDKPPIPTNWEQGMGFQALFQSFEEHKGGQLHEPRAL
jgi:hypothetical protein